MNIPEKMKYLLWAVFEVISALIDRQFDSHEVWNIDSMTEVKPRRHYFPVPLIFSMLIFFSYFRSYVDSARNINYTDEVLVQTVAGSYRFEGVSQEFTRKLYDWEKFRGISPGSSTFRLLGHASEPLFRETNIEAPMTAATSKTALRYQLECNFGK